jgi:hypothetical protein
MLGGGRGDEMLCRTMFLTTVVATVFCAAVNAYTFQVAYPLWRFVGAGSFRAVHQEYLERLWPVITVPHVVMFFASAGLMWWRPAFVPKGEAIAVFMLAAGVVGISAFVAGPVHGRFEQTGVADEAGMRALIGISAARVVMMVGACAVLCVEMMRAFRAAA